MLSNQSIVIIRMKVFIELQKEIKKIYDETIKPIKDNNGINLYHYVSGKSGTRKFF